MARADRRLGAGRGRPAPSCARCGWPASATTCATSPSPRATRSRRSCGSASRSTPTASTTWSRPSTRSPTPRSTTLVEEYDDTYEVAPELRAGGERHESLRYAARIELGLRDFLDAGGFRAFTTNFEDLGGLRQLPGLAVQRLMADGYGFGGEGDWKTVGAAAHAEGRWPPACPAARRSWRTTPTTSSPGERADPRRAHARGLPDRSPPAPRRCEIHPLGIGGREDPVRLVFDAAPGPAVVVGLADLGDRFRLVANEIDVVAPPEPLPQPAGGARGVAARGPTCAPPPRPG